jgi:hypothetical protein
MINLRRLPMFQAGASSLPKHYEEAWAEKDEAAELRILEIAEIAYILEVDGFSEREIFRRIGLVHSPKPDLERICRSGNPLRCYIVEHLAVHAPIYLKLGPGLLNSALAVAELWATIAAERSRAANWPPQEMLGPPGPLSDPAFNAGEADENLMLPDGAIEALNRFVARARFPALAELRRMKARAVPGDELRNYSTGAQSFQFMMGSAGIALVRGGRSVDFIEIIRN